MTNSRYWAGLLLIAAGFCHAGPPSTPQAKPRAAESRPVALPVKSDTSADAPGIFLDLILGSGLESCRPVFHRAFERQRLKLTDKAKANAIFRIKVGVLMDAARNRLRWGAVLFTKEGSTIFRDDGTESGWTIVGTCEDLAPDLAEKLQEQVMSMDSSPDKNDLWSLPAVDEGSPAADELPPPVEVIQPVSSPRPATGRYFDAAFRAAKQLACERNLSLKQANADGSEIYDAECGTVRCVKDACQLTLD